MRAEPHIIYTDDSIILVAKPALIHSVSQKQSDSHSIADWLVEKFPGISAASENSEDGGLINRLDFETSGILVAAKNRPCWLALKEQFSKHEIKKRYFAFVEGKPKAPLQIIGYLGNRYRGSKKVTVLRHPEARFQYTESHIVCVVSYDPQFDNSLIEIEANTGARHQIRAHCASIGHPLVGDILYESKKTLSLGEHTTPPFALHAAEISFLHPENGEGVSFSQPRPGYFSY